MKHLFIPYRLAVIAKEKGFNEPCNRSYDTYGNECNTSRYDKNSELIGYVSSPIYQQIVDWFREKHKLHIVINIGLPHESKSIMYYANIIKFGTHHKNKYRSVFFHTNTEALNKAIEEAFKLI